LRPTGGVRSVRGSRKARGVLPRGTARIMHEGAVGCRLCAANTGAVNLSERNWVEGADGNVGHCGMAGPMVVGSGFLIIAAAQDGGQPQSPKHGEHGARREEAQRTRSQPGQWGSARP
jgi:hypothetical protein